MKLKCMLKIWPTISRLGKGIVDFDMALVERATSGTDEKHEVGLFQRICRCFTKVKR